MELQNQTIEETDQSPINTSGQGKNAVVPKEIKGWNWGAFFLSWIWGLGHHVWWSLLILIPHIINYVVITSSLFNKYGMFYLCLWLFIVELVMIIILAREGNEYAWRARYHNSIEEFSKREKIWAYVAILLTICGLMGLLGAWYQGWLSVQFLPLYILLIGFAWVGG